MRAFGSASRSASWRLLHSRVAGPVSRAASHAIAAAPRWSPFRLLSPLRSWLKGEVSAARLVEILEVLDHAGLAYWLAGGWGIDALAGSQSRRHDDVDVVLDDFERQVGTACDALARIGFRVVERNERPAVLLGRQWTLDDGQGCRVDLLRLEVALVVEALGADQAVSSGGESGDAGRAALYAEGWVGSRSAPCLSVASQRVLHSGFAARAVDRHDVRRLPARAGTHPGAPGRP